MCLVMCNYGTLIMKHSKPNYKSDIVATSNTVNPITSQMLLPLVIKQLQHLDTSIALEISAEFNQFSLSVSLGTFFTVLLHLLLSW